jgi:hypothetical protein
LARALPRDYQGKIFVSLTFYLAGADFETGAAIAINCDILKGRWTTLPKLFVIILNFFLLTVPGTLLWAAGEGLEMPEKLVKEPIKLANLGRFNYFFAKWYNDNLWVYAILVTLLMGVVGLIIALGTDRLLKMIGMEVSKIEHHE